MNIEAVRKLLRRECRAAGGQGNWAASAGVSAAHVSTVLHGRRAPGPTMLRALGLERVVAVDYRHARPPPPNGNEGTGP